MSEDQNGYKVNGRADGFTPLIDTVVAELGTVAGVVYGVVYRHCQMRRGVCDASQPTMARLTRLAERTIRKWLRVLEDAGYIRDVTDPPDKEGVPRTYVTTGKAFIQVSISAETPAPNTGVENGTPAPNAAPPAPNAGVPRHEMPPTPAPNAAKDTIQDTSQGDKGGYNSSSSVENPTPAPETPPEREDDDSISPSLNDLTNLGITATNARRIIKAVGAENASLWAAYVLARGDVQNPAGYLWRAFQNGDLEHDPPALPPSGKENPRTEVNGWLCDNCGRTVAHIDAFCSTCGSCPDCCECETLSPKARPAPTVGTCPSCGKAYRQLCPTCGRCTVGVGDLDPCCVCGDSTEAAC